MSFKSTITGSNGSTFGYSSYSGVSMATPHVAGVVGLLRMYFPDCKAFQIHYTMIATTKYKGNTGCDVNYGHGIVQAKAAFEHLTQNPCDSNELFKEPEGGCAEFSCYEDLDCYQGSGYSDVNMLHTTSMCLASDDYTFTINDAYGDGICCEYGGGGYIIKVDGTAV